MGIKFGRGFAKSPVGTEDLPIRAIGQVLPEGVVFWTDPNSGGRHGLMCAKIDLFNDKVPSTRNLTWQPQVTENLTTGAWANGVGGGKHNTLCAQMKFLGFPYNIGSPPAATNNNVFDSCAKFSVTVGGITYNDWYVPSKIEAQLMAVIKAQLIADFGLEAQVYWTSTESRVILAGNGTNGNAWYFNYFNNTFGDSGKHHEFRVRVIREF